jgi:hypothetical protein
MRVRNRRPLASEIRNKQECDSNSACHKSPQKQLYDPVHRAATERWHQ